MTNQVEILAPVDVHILRELQKEGRISFAQLARRVGLTTTPCIERVKTLEKQGIINPSSVPKKQKPI